MIRRILAALLALSLLAACGQAILITLPGLPGPGPVEAPRGYDRLFSPAPHAFRYSGEGEPVRRGRAAERYELREGDCGGSDCGNFRARAEITQDPDADLPPLNRDVWIGWSFYNDNIAPVTRETWLGTVLGQWKLEGEQPAIFRLVQQPQGAGNWGACDPRICTPGGDARFDVVMQLDEMRQAYGWGPAQNDGNICRLFSMAAAQGRWTDIVINTNFGTDSFGYLRVWVDGQLRCNYQGPLISPPRALTPVAGVNHRRGIFLSYTERWVQNFGAAPKPTLIAYYDEFRIGSSRAEVDPAIADAAGAAARD